MIKYVFLDLDDTLLDFTQAEAVALGRAPRGVGAPVQRAAVA